MRDIALVSEQGSSITFNGSLEANIVGTSAISAFATMATGSRADFNGGGHVNMTGSSTHLFFASSSSALTMTGMTAQANVASPTMSLLRVSQNSDLVATTSSVQGANTGGPVFGLDAASAGAGHITLDRTSVTLNSAGSGIRVRGNTTTVDMTGSSITGFGNGANNSLAQITNLTGFGSGIDGPGSLILNATNSTLSGNVLVDAPGAEGPNAFTANLSGTTQLTGNVTVAGAPSTANITLNDSAQWTGAGTNVTNVTVNPGTAWNVTGNSSITGTLTNTGQVAYQYDGSFHTVTTTNYAGGGTLRLNTQLGDNASATDQLIVNGGTVSGTTGIVVTQQGGPGAQTSGNGIPLIIAANGTTTGADAFTLLNKGAQVNAGPFAYLLSRGTTGSSADQNGWYLVSHSTGSGAGPGPGPGPDQPLYRGEVAMHAVYGAMARQLGLLTLGTFHDRSGDQQLAGPGGRERAWARVFGQRMEQSHSGDVRPHTEGDYYGLQGGIDAIRTVSATGHQDRAGLFAAYATGKVDVSGTVLATPNTLVGRTDLDATSFGAYWSHLAPSGWYTDAVVMGTAYDGDGHTRDGSDVGVSGTGAIVSLEGGFPLLRLWGMKLEQQGQLVYQYLNLDEANDPYAYIAHRTPDSLHGRVGWRLSADGLPWLFKPFLKANIWQDFAGKDSAIYEHTHEIVNRHRATTLELGGGFVANIAPNVGLWASADYTTDIGGTEQEREAVRGTAGLRVTW